MLTALVATTAVARGAFIAPGQSRSPSGAAATSSRGGILMTSPSERDNLFVEEMKNTAKLISRRGFGILAADESVPTVGKRLRSVGVENTAENRRAFREVRIAHRTPAERTMSSTRAMVATSRPRRRPQVLFTTLDLEKYISGCILFDETMFQSTAGGESFVHCLQRRGILVSAPSRLDARELRARAAALSLCTASRRRWARSWTPACARSPAPTARHARAASTAWGIG